MGLDTRVEPSGAGVRRFLRARQPRGRSARMVRLTTVSVLFAIAVVAAGCGDTAPAGLSTAPPDGARERAEAAFEQLPLTFVESGGRFQAHGPGHAIYITPREVALALQPSPDEGVSLALRFLGADPRAEAAGSGRAPGTVNYLRGDDPSRWRTDVPTYYGVVYRELWPGIDVRLSGREGALKYEFRVRPGARPEDIRLAYRGAQGLRRDGDGALQIETALGDLRDAPPISYQRIGGVRVPVESSYALGGDSAYGFAVGPYDRDHELIIDPSLAYSSFLGGASHEMGSAIQTDAAGNAYVTGLHAVAQLPDDGRRLRPHGLGQQQPGRVRQQGQCGRHRARLLDVPRRRQLRVGARPGRRPGRQRVRDRQDDVLDVPDDRRRVRPHVQRRQLPPVRHRPGRRVRRQAQPGGLGPRLLDVPRRHAARRDVRHRTRRRAQRVRDRGDHVVQLPDDGRRVRPDRQRRIRRVRHEAQRDGLGARVLDAARRVGQRAARGRGRRRRRQRGGRRVDAIDRVPHHARGVRPDAERRRVRRAVRPVRDEAQRRRLGPRLLDVRRRLQERLRRRLRARRRRQRVPGGRHAVAGLPDDAGHVRSGVREAAAKPSSSSSTRAGRGSSTRRSSATRARRRSRRTPTATPGSRAPAGHPEP